MFSLPKTPWAGYKFQYVKDAANVWPSDQFTGVYHVPPGSLTSWFKGVLRRLAPLEGDFTEAVTCGDSCFIASRVSSVTQSDCAHRFERIRTTRLRRSPLSSRLGWCTFTERPHIHVWKSGRFPSSAQFKFPLKHRSKGRELGEECARIWRDGHNTARGGSMPLGCIQTTSQWISMFLHGWLCSDRSYMHIATAPAFQRVVENFVCMPGYVCMGRAPGEGVSLWICL